MSVNNRLANRGSGKCAQAYRHTVGRRVWGILCVLALIGGLGTPASAQMGPEDVVGLQILNAQDLRPRDIVIANTEFIQFGGHFDIATLDWDEIIGPGAENLVLPSSGPNQVAWWDVVIKVTRSDDAARDGRGVMISIDKDVTNNTTRHWSDFHMTLGRGTGAGFVESDEVDLLYFKNDPAPLNEKPVTPVPNPIQAFENPPMMDEPTAADNLWWFQGGGLPGQAPGTTTDYWLAINVPGSLFGPGQTMATFTLREHASIPEPATVGLLGLAGLMLLPRRRS